MFICHSHNFVFLRIPKNASSSIAHYLVDNLGNNSSDLWTEVNDRNGPKMNGVDQRIRKKYRHHSRYIHLTLQELIEEKLISVEDATRMNKIGIIRNPLERQLSLYFWLCRNRKSVHDVNSFRKQFSKGKHESDSNNQFTQVDYLKVNGELCDNTIFWKYDDLEQLVRQFVRSKNPDYKTEIPRHKAEVSPDEDRNKLIDKYYDDETRAAVLDYYSEDFRIYNTL